MWPAVTTLRLQRIVSLLVLAILVLAPQSGWCAGERLVAPGPDSTALKLGQGAVIATGNDWIALPEIRASDGAIVSFNVLSMRDRGVLQVQGSPTVNSGPEQNMIPAVEPWVATGAAPTGLHICRWRLLDYWIPVATARSGPLRFTIIYATPPHSRAAWIRMVAVNDGPVARKVRFGVTARWGGLARIVYSPSMIIGQRLQSDAPPWIPSTHVFRFVENETVFAWSLGHPDCTHARRAGDAYTVACQRLLAPGRRAVANFIVSVGLDESSAGYQAKVLAARILHFGAAALLGEERAWLAPRLRTTGNPALDEFMNRNLLFSSFFAWGRTYDTEQFVGVTSRSPRYYVSAAYWDRDAMLWSFPALLDTDVRRARDALNVALGMQLRDAGTHSRFIDGVTLEPGYELDENAAPIIALAEYWRRTGDTAYVSRHRTALVMLLAKLLRHRGQAGLYWTEQDSQDENRRWSYETYDNALVWRALRDAAAMYRAMGESAAGNKLDARARHLHATIMHLLVASGAPGASGPIFAFGWDGQHYKFDDVPPGSLLKLPALGFISQRNPLFRRTCWWLHSKFFKYSNAGDPYGLPGSYRLPETTSWSIADHLRLRSGRSKALKILLASPWDGGIVSEQVDPKTDATIPGGGAFATAAGYVAATVCDLYCRPRPAGRAISPSLSGGTH